LKIKTYSIDGLILFEPTVHGDARGFFLETFHRQRYQEAGINHEFVQDNHSLSVKGTLRGLHYQIRNPQAKLVRCLEGSIYDVAVDIRPGSPTFGQWVGEILSAENHLQLYVPEGFAHGFQVISERAQMAYKCSDYYAQGDEGGILWSDPELAIAWPEAGTPLLSEKDKNYPLFRDHDSA